MVALDLRSIDKVLGFLLSFLEFLDLSSLLEYLGLFAMGRLRDLCMLLCFVFVIMC